MASAGLAVLDDAPLPVSGGLSVQGGLAVYQKSLDFPFEGCNLLVVSATGTGILVTGLRGFRSETRVVYLRLLFIYRWGAFGIKKRELPPPRQTHPSSGTKGDA